MLHARNLEQRYGGRSIVNVDEFDLAAGSATAIVGPNGSGKSTLLRLLAFVEVPSRGELTLDGRSIHTSNDRREARREVTLVEQHPLLFDSTVRVNLRYALALRRLSRPEADERIESALAATGATHLIDRRARALSGGETQRVAIARALAIRPRVLLMDEPLSAGDRSAMALLAEALGAAQATGTSVCFTSHLLEEAYRWAGSVVALMDGHVTGATPENLFRAVLPEGKGPKVVPVGPLELVVVSDRSGPATIVIPPDSIVVSRRAIESSARNQFPGKVMRLADDGHGGVVLTVDTGTDLVVRVTPSAVEDLHLALGTRVVLSVKAVAVRVF